MTLEEDMKKATRRGKSKTSSKRAPIRFKDQKDGGKGQDKIDARQIRGSAVIKSPIEGQKSCEESGHGGCCRRWHSCVGYRAR